MRASLIWGHSGLQNEKHGQQLRHLYNETVDWTIERKADSLKSKWVMILSENR